jgi:hypothetical protein
MRGSLRRNWVQNVEAFGGGPQTRSFAYVTDVVDALVGSQATSEK